jgi:hypothetical protein
MGSGLDDWIYWHFFTITTAHNQWLSQTRSIPYWTTSVFPSAWLTWFWFTSRPLLQLQLFVGQHSTAEHWTLLRMPNDWTLLNWTLFFNSGRTEGRSLPPTVRLLLRLFVTAGACLRNRRPAVVTFVTLRHGPHRKRRVQQFFYCCICILAAITFLPSRCLETIGYM